MHVEEGSSSKRGSWRITQDDCSIILLLQLSQEILNNNPGAGTSVQLKREGCGVAFDGSRKQSPSAAPSNL